MRFLSGPAEKLRRYQKSSLHSLSLLYRLCQQNAGPMRIKLLNLEIPIFILSEQTVGGDLGNRIKNYIFYCTI